MTAGLHQSCNAMILGGVEPRSIDRRPGGVGEHSCRSLSSECRFANALLTGEKPGMVKRAAPPRRRELVDRAILSRDHGIRSFSASMSFAVTFSGEPEALMSRTRSGSVAAIVRKAVSTLR